MRIAHSMARRRRRHFSSSFRSRRQMKLYFTDDDNAKHVADILMIANGNSSLVAFRAVYLIFFSYSFRFTSNWNIH